MGEITSREQFDRQAEHYNAEWNQWSEASLAWLLDRAGCAGQERLLDVATGTGFTALAFASRVAEVVGLDVSEGMLRQARQQAAAAGVDNVRFEHGPAESMPFPDRHFDLVTCRVAPHHFLSIAGFVAESARVLKPGGRLLIADTTVPDGDRQVDAWQNRVELLRDRSHVRNYSPSEWRAFVEAEGFVVESLEQCDEGKPPRLGAWLEKSGCTGDTAAEVTRLFAEAPEAAKRAFAIREAPDGDTEFNWMRVVLAARKGE